MSNIDCLLTCLTCTGVGAGSILSSYVVAALCRLSSTPVGVSVGALGVGDSIVYEGEHTGFAGCSGAGV